MDIIRIFTDVLREIRISKTCSDYLLLPKGEAMKILYTKPDSILAKKWYDDGGSYDIWYQNETSIYHPEKMPDIPEELRAFLIKWRGKMEEYKKDYRELYPVKLAHIDFIYQDVVYKISPMTVGASYLTDFMSDKPYEVSWDSFFEAHEREIREDMKASLGITHSRYTGFLD